MNCNCYYAVVTCTLYVSNTTLYVIIIEVYLAAYTIMHNKIVLLKELMQSITLDDEWLWGNDPYELKKTDNYTKQLMLWM